MNKKITAGTFLKPLGAKYIKGDYSRNHGMHSVYDLNGTEILAAYDHFCGDVFFELWNSKTDFHKFLRYENAAKRVTEITEELTEILS